MNDHSIPEESNLSPSSGDRISTVPIKEEPSGLFSMRDDVNIFNKSIQLTDHE